jgi:hypothetical protein
MKKISWGSLFVGVALVLVVQMLLKKKSTA